MRVCVCECVHVFVLVCVGVPLPLPFLSPSLPPLSLSLSVCSKETASTHRISSQRGIRLVRDFARNGVKSNNWLVLLGDRSRANVTAINVGGMHLSIGFALAGTVTVASLASGSSGCLCLL